MPTLADVLQGLALSPNAKLPLSDSVRTITSDSNEATAGAIFVAIRGGTHDGHQFIAKAVAQGALLVIGEEERDTGQVPYLRVPDTRLALARIAANFYGNPSHGMWVVGVTGTSGKTTLTYLVESILAAAGRKVGVLGTVNFRFGGKVLPSTHTSPGPIETQALLAEMKRAGCDAAVMEVSSHALKQHRAGFVEFDAGGFTNLTPEHLDFHPDMEDYFAAKRLLFTRSAGVARAAGKAFAGAVNLDDEYGRRLARDLRGGADAPARVVTYGLGSEHRPEIDGSKLTVDLEGVRGTVGDVRVDSKLLGRFNASNIICAIAIAKGLGVPAANIAKGIAALQAVPGRLERVPNTRGIHALVDYAHKSDALQKVLETLKQSLVDTRSSGKLITVFGCGGDRDRLKRPVMGRIATSLSDRVIVTSDNPRTEDPASIIAEITAGLADRKNFEVEPDRKTAIERAIFSANAGDIVVIAGKGHEDYQIIRDPSATSGTRKIHFDDREIAAAALLAKKS